MSTDSESVERRAYRRAQPRLSATLLGRYATGLEELESSAESAALKDNRLYVTSAQANVLDIVDVSNPSAPILSKRIDLSSYGASVQSVDVSRHGLVAVAVAAATKTDPGQVVFFNRQGDVLRAVRVGALPDMVAFTHDGRLLVVANEGEPDCYGEGCSDPEGTVSIVSVYAHRLDRAVRTVRFDGVALPKGVRVFGPGATPAQDLEPEYVSISEDDRTAYVTLQENNAIAVIDLHAASVVEVRALGYKDFSAPPVTTHYDFTELPSIGMTDAGQEIALGGFSGLFFEGKTADGKLKFVTHTDRGPNGEPFDGKRPFLLPDFAPRLVRLELDPRTSQIRITQQLELRRPDGVPVTGLPNTRVLGGTANSAHNDEVAVDLFGSLLPLDPLGGDFEGVVVAEDSSFWMADEYRPAIYHFDPAGVLLERLVPIGSHAAAGLATPASGTEGELGTEALPGVLGQRRQNRGFEAIALQDGKLYAFVQSPIRNPATLENSALNALTNVRLVEIDPNTRETRQFLYALDNPALVGADDSRADKIGDATAIPGGGFMVIERDDDSSSKDPVATITKKIYAFSIAGATEITAKDVLYAGKTLDQMSVSELSTAGVKPVSKVLHVDLVTAGYSAVEKVEGLAYIDPTTLAVINDNDFGVASITIDNVSGTFVRSDGYTPESVRLGIVKSRGIDASDRDGVVNIRSWPVRGMYQPDAIANFRIRDETYLLTANEGDARDYDGFVEEVRSKIVSASYPSIPAMTRDSELGRLTITNSPPGDDYTTPYVFGTRSFSIWSATSGAQIYDSDAELERRAADAFPAFFNSNHSSNDFDTRSDNKGPEPEGVAVGKIGPHTFAFVGLERTGGVLIYDVTAPGAPRFVQYVNDRDFSTSAVGPDSGAEIIRFVASERSPIRAALLLQSNEITGTVTLWRLDPR